MTDANGRVSAVVADLDLLKMDRNTYQQCVTGKCGDLGDQGGHLIAATLGGVGDRINLVPQAATLNNGPWKAMENEFKAALDVGKDVSLKIELGYPPGQSRRSHCAKNSTGAPMGVHTATVAGLRILAGLPSPACLATLCPAPSLHHPEPEPIPGIVFKPPWAQGLTRKIELSPKNAPSSFNPTGMQANFVTLSINPATGSSTIVGSGHLVVLP